MSKSYYKKKIALTNKTFIKLKIKTLSESGIITSVKDGVAVVYGLQKGCAGEMIYTRSARNPNGMLLNLHRYYASLVIFGNVQYKYGTRVYRTRRLMGIPVSLLLFGRVIDALGSVIDGGKLVRSKVFKKVDTKAIGIIDRQSVFEPMLTGLISVDAMTPIGCGQRELIIGDRQTGKTSLALDAILNQIKYGFMFCIYVAIGQKKGAIAKIVDFFFNSTTSAKAKRSLIVISSSSSDSATLQFFSSLYRLYYWRVTRHKRMPLFNYI